MTTIILGALLVGLILGLLGSGGSTVMVPTLVYFVGHEAKVAIAESMAIVGAISVAGSIPFALAKQVHWRSVFLFGVPAMAGTFLGAYLGGLASDALQLVVFGLVVLAAATLMIKKAFGEASLAADQAAEDAPLNNPKSIGNLMIVAEGVVVGALTGFVGVGGGFLIVPALLVFAKLPMRMAIGTSLVIIVFKCVVGFAKYQSYLVNHDLTVDWQTIGIFSLVGVVGCLIGQQLNAKLNQRVLKQVFAVFLVLIGSFVILREGNNLIQPENKTDDTEQTTAKVIGADQSSIRISNECITSAKN